MTLVIVGGSGAIGSRVAHLAHARGERVHLVGRNEERLKALSEAYQARYTRCDVNKGEDLKTLAEAIDGPVSGLVYAVGSINLKPFARLTPEDFLNDYHLNALGAAQTLQALLPALKAADNASVVLVSSVAARKGFVAHASISMAKAAVEGLSVALSAELAPHIRVNCVAPSLTKTPLAQPILRSEKMAEAIGQMHPLKRLGEPEDVAGLIDFLISDQAGWITGQVFGVDGGRAAIASVG
ncbi:SDR family NAD(P)-dependent oxidoreductase [Woodsholea maritima]|uniref:SDR family NAD(P)-dependent oxidoreductase n=1 Tax=Woodsholea maritima TaxID=240237 RepID=UPI0003697200|nr:SDR family oxidoreductase [Woodsholea maritima]